MGKVNSTSNKLSARDKIISIVSSNYNFNIVNSLINGAMDAFYHHGGAKNNISIISVPGAFEIPGTIKQLIKYKRQDAIIALGSIIKGGTPHFDYIANESSRGIADLSKTNDIPIIFGILTTNNLEDALERSDVKKGNKGWESMETALSMIDTYKQIRSNIV